MPNEDKQITEKLCRFSSASANFRRAVSIVLALLGKCAETVECMAFLWNELEWWSTRP